MNMWLLAALALLPGFVACGLMLWRATIVDAFVAMNLAGVLTVLEMILLSEGFHQYPFFELALVLTVMMFAGGLMYVRFLERLV